MYKLSSFNNLLFNPLSEEPLLKAYPKLAEIVSDEWRKEADLDKILRFVILVHDPKSILVVNEKDLNYRKQVACELADIKDENLAQGVCSFENELCLDLTMRYLMRFAKSKEWAAIVSLEFTFWESMKLLLKPIADKDAKDKEILDAVSKKSAIKNEIDQDIHRLDTYYKNFFGSDAELQNAKKVKRYTPESVGKKLTNVQKD